MDSLENEFSVVGDTKRRNDVIKTTGSSLNELETHLKAMNSAALKSQTEVLQLPVDVWEHVFRFISANDVIALSSTCHKLQWIVQQLKSDFNLTYNYHLNLNFLLNHALSKTCTSININHCYWLEPSVILEIISKTNLKHLHVIECNINEDVMKAVLNLHLKSLSITYSKEWCVYFKENSGESVMFLQELISLEIAAMQSVCATYITSEQSALFDIYSIFLTHCKQLQYLKICECFFIQQSEYTIQHPQFTSETKILPNLKSLTFHITHEDNRRVLENFLEKVFEDRAIPLDHVDLGRHTWHYLTQYNLFDSLSLSAKESLILKSYPGKLSQFKEDASIRCEAMHISFRLHCLYNDEFRNFAEKAVSNSKKLSEKLFLSNYQLFENALKGVQLFAINCPQITVLDLSILKWTSTETEGTPGYLNYGKNDKNEALIEALTHFKNLEDLRITPLMLHCDYYCALDRSQKYLKALPFWKVTKTCEKLRELRIINFLLSLFECAIHMDSLYDIAHCKNLKVLHLGNFRIRGTTNFQLSKVTEGCAQLEDLKIHLYPKIPTIDGEEIMPEVIVENSLDFTKNIKKLRFDLDDSFLSQTLLDSLCMCEKLEKIKLRLKRYSDEDVAYLIDTLPKFKQLFFFVIDFDKRKRFNDRLLPVLQKIKGEKPAFYASVNDQHTFSHSRSNVHMQYYFDM